MVAAPAFRAGGNPPIGFGNGDFSDCRLSATGPQGGNRGDSRRAIGRNPSPTDRRDLVRIAGRSDELGRPFLYGTTRRFLQVFGLQHLDELPKADVLRTSRPAPACSPNTLTDPDSNTDIPKQSHQFQRAEEETNVKTLITPRQRNVDENTMTTLLEPRHDDLLDVRSPCRQARRRRGQRPRRRRRRYRRRRRLRRHRG